MIARQALARPWHMKRFFCYAVAVLGLVLAPARSVWADAHTKDAADVRLALDRFLTAFDNLEWETFRSSFDDNVTVFFPTPEPPLRYDGRAAVEAHFQEVFKAIRASSTSGPPFQHLRPKDLRIDIIGREVALVTFHLENAERTARRTIVFKRTAGVWRIVHLHASNADLAK